MGLGLIIGMSVYNAKVSAKLEYFITTTGTVIDYKVSSHLDEDGFTEYLYAEIAAFEADGVTYTVTNSISSNNGVKRIGDSVTIAYNPDNPNDCIFFTPNNKLGITVAFGFGVLCVLASVCMFVGYYVQYRQWKKYMR